MAEPSVSVVVPNYNDSGTILGALNSLLGQTRRPDEIIVIDDGSTDESIAILEEFAKAYPLVRVLRNDFNRGVLFTLNRAFREASGTFIYSGSANDVVRPRLLEIGTRLLTQFPDAGLFSGEAACFDQSGHRWHDPFDFARDEGFFTAQDLLAFSERQYMPPFRSQATIYRRALVLGIGGFRAELGFHADYFVWEILAYRHGFAYSPEILADIRIDSTGYSGRAVRQWKPKRDITLLHAALLAQPEFQDVRPYLVKTGALCVDATSVVRTALRHRAIRPYLSKRLLKRALMPLVPLTRPKRRAFLQRIWRPAIGPNARTEGSGTGV